MRNGYGVYATIAACISCRHGDNVCAGKNGDFRAPVVRSDYVVVVTEKSRWWPKTTTVLRLRRRAVTSPGGVGPGNGNSRAFASVLNPDEIATGKAIGIERDSRNKHCREHRVEWVRELDGQTALVRRWRRVSISASSPTRR